MFVYGCRGGGVHSSGLRGRNTPRTVNTAKAEQQRLKQRQRQRKAAKQVTRHPDPAAPAEKLDKCGHRNLVSAHLTHPLNMVATNKVWKQVATNVAAKVLAFNDLFIIKIDR